MPDLSTATGPKKATTSDDAECVARSVVEALKEKTSLEAITIDHQQHKVSVATLGKTDESRLTATITQSLQSAYHHDLADRCQLLQGRDQCDTCGHPLSETERQGITIRHQGDATTIARATC